MWLICYIYVTYKCFILYVSFRHIWNITFRLLWALLDLVSPYMGNIFQVDVAYVGAAYICHRNL